MRARWLVAFTVVMPGCRGDFKGGGAETDSGATTGTDGDGIGSSGGTTGAPSTGSGTITGEATESGTTSAGGASSGAGGTTSGTTDSASGGSTTSVEPPRDKVIFVSSRQYTGNIGGLLVADSECQSMAAEAGLAGTFKAWLGTDTEGPADRFTHDGRYVLVDGTLIADDWADLTDGSIAHFIDQTEDGGAPLPTTESCETTQMVWTGVYANGNTAGQDFTSCAEWTDDDAGGMFGRVDATDTEWSFVCTTGACTEAAAIYCVEQ
jgi:hypothetical protein